MQIEAPNTLPGGLKNLSYSSVDLYLRCPEKWRRRYLANEFEAPVGIQILGRAVHAVEAQSYHAMLATGEPHSIVQVADELQVALTNEDQKAEVEYPPDEPFGTLLDRGVRMLSEYHRVIVPAMQPTAVEQEFNIKLHPDHEWGIKGFIDLISGFDDGWQTLPSGPNDIKTVRKATPQGDVDASPQATLYTYATMGDDDEYKTFRVHELKDLKGGAVAEIKETTRTREAQMLYLQRVAAVAREIDWRTSSGNWQGAPPMAWWCRATSCGYHSNCAFATR